MGNKIFLSLSGLFFLVSNALANPIVVLNATFGTPTNLCLATLSVSKSCDGKSSCQVKASSQLCDNYIANLIPSYKFLIVTYDCTVDGVKVVTAAENEIAKLSC